MSKEDVLRDDMLQAESHYSTVMKKWSRAYAKYKECEDERMEAEQLVLDIRRRIETIAMDEGRFHDQMAMDFDIDKYGRNKHFLEIKREHNARWDRCACYIQCPTCKKYAVKMEYKLMRNSFNGERLIFDVKPIEGKETGVYIYCPKCSEGGDSE